MWTALVLVWISSVPLSQSHTVSDEPRSLVTTKMWPRAVKRSMPRDTVPRAHTIPTERTATVPPAPVTPTTGTQAASLNSTKVTAEVTTHWANMSTPTTGEGTTDSTTSRTLAPPTSSGPSSAGQTQPNTTAGLPSLSTPRAEVPSTNASTSPRTATVITMAPHTRTVATGTPHTRTVATGTPHTRTVAAGTVNTSGPPTGTLSPAKSTPTNTSTMSPILTSGVQSQGTTIQVTTGQPVHSTVGRSTPSPSDITLETTTTRSVASVSPTVVTTTRSVASVSPTVVTTTHSVASVSPTVVTTTRSVASVSPTVVTTTTRSVASVSPTVVTTTQVQTREPPTSPSPELEATSLTTQPSPALPTQGPGTPLTTEQVETKTTASTASTGPTPRSSGDLKVPTTDACQFSTQGQYLVVTTEPLTPSLVNRTLLLVVLVLGVTLFIAVLVMFALQAYESYKKKDYTQVDYLINGMYADSEM